MKKFLVNAAVFFVVIFFSATNAQAVWRLDGSDENEIPRNWRTMIDAWHIEMYYDDGNHDGLEKLHASASGQPSLDGVKKLFEEISTIAAQGANIYLLDLREESHGFAEGYPVSFYVEKNRGNYFRGFEESYELEQLESLLGKSTEFVPLGNFDKAHYKAVTFAPKKISTEKQAAKDAGFIYVRFAATDMIFPSPQVVDSFLNFVKTLHENDWLHFHCQAGHGRTTTFLVFYDILKNPELSLEDICKRQYYLGGSNLLEKSEGNDFYANAQNSRAELIKLFYKYAHENHGESWSEFYLKNS